MPDVPVMAPPLQVIPIPELSRRNNILSVSDWQPDCRLFIRLVRPFKKKYMVGANVEYEIPNDPYYWKAEYF